MIEFINKTEIIFFFINRLIGVERWRSAKQFPVLVIQHDRLRVYSIGCLD